VENQRCIFHEDIPVPGTDLALHYAGNRTSGFKPRVTIPASGPSVPISLKRIVVQMTVAGRTFETNLPPEPNRQVEFVWDGLDYLGREVTGSVPATISIGFVYPAFYYSSFDSVAPAFARAGNNVTGVWARQEVTSWKQSLTTIYRGRAAVLAEGWTLSAHHYLDPNDPDTLLKGDGETVNHNTLVIDTLAGNGQEGYSGDGGPAAQATFRGPSGLAVDSAGNIYIADYYSSVVRKVDTRGMITTVAGNGQNGFSGDGGPATQARLYAPRKIALDKAGNIYIVDSANHRIRKVNPSGIISTVAGKDCAGEGQNGDGGPATQACLGDLVMDLAVDSAGNIYMVDGRNNLIRKVDGNGIITAIAGNGQYGYSGDGGPATLAHLSSPQSVALDNGGNLYIGEGLNSNRIRKVDTSGIISTFAGNGQYGFSGDGGPAIQAALVSPSSLAIDRVGNVYLSSEWHTRIRKVNTQGIITTVAGNGQEGYSGDGGPAVQANLKWPFSLALDSPGNIYVTDWGNQRVRKVFRPGAFKSLVVAGDMVFAEENGWGQVMSNTGLHQSTIDLAGGKTLRTFGYDQADKLVSISDRFGNRTTIQRNGGGVPLSITSPDGMVTRLTVDGNNHLVSVIYPDGAAYAFAYTPDGLLTEKVDPRGNRFGQQYDATGLITRVFDPEGGSWDFSRTVDNAGYTLITLQTAEGQTTTYQDRTDSTGAYTSTKTDPAGSVSTFTRSADDLFETEQTTCGLSRAWKYDLDPVYQFKYLREATQTSPAGLTQSTTENRNYLDTNGDTIPERTTKTLSLNGRNWILTNDALSGTETGASPLGRTVTRTYDPENLLTRNVTISGLLPLSYTYDERGRITGSTRGDRTATIAYDTQGNIESLVTPDQKTYRYTYDALGRPKTQVFPDNTLLRYNYDLNGNMDLLTNPNNIAYGFDYSQVNLRNTMALPASGSYRYQYDKDRNLKAVVFPSSKEISHTYTTGRLSKVSTPEGETNYSYHCGSLLAAVEKGTEMVSYGYDGALLKTDSRTGLLNQTIGYTYDNDFRLASMTYGESSQALTYDDDGLLAGAGAFIITRSAQNGFPVGITDGNATISRTFNGYGELEGITYSLGGAERYRFTLTRDMAGRVTNKAEIIGGGSRSLGYAYDNNGRLIEVRENGQIVEAYTYDANGNRLLETNQHRGIAQRAYLHSLEDHLLSAGTDTYQFDADGFLTGKSTAQGAMATVYSSRGELLSASLPDATVITYDHDPLGRRIAKKVNGAVVEKYLWKDTTTLLAVYNGSDNLVTRFNYGDDRLPLSMTHNGSTYYLLVDPIGSLRAVTDASGNIVKRVDYDSFGNILVDTNPSLSVPFGFAGGLHDRTTGLVRFGARDYDPGIGRWTARDPIDFGGGDTNLYGYVMNDPVNWVDPEGEKPWYGNYCGPGNNPGTQPIDDLDAACEGHDKCFARGALSAMDVLSPPLNGYACTIKNNCDRELVSKAKVFKPANIKQRIARRLIMIIFGELF
jgi:RHS repeat-associated protein